MKKISYLKILSIITLIFGINTGYAQSAWPPETGSKVKNNALEYPTTLGPADNSFSYYLNKKATITSMQITDTGPVFVLKVGKKNLICFLYPSNPESDQNVATSKCYFLN